jgi:hypothetical protein
LPPIRQLLMRCGQRCAGRLLCQFIGQVDLHRRHVRSWMFCLKLRPGSLPWTAKSPARPPARPPYACPRDGTPCDGANPGCG